MMDGEIIPLASHLVECGAVWYYHCLVWYNIVHYSTPWHGGQTHLLVTSTGPTLWAVLGRAGRGLHSHRVGQMAGNNTRQLREERAGAIRR